jgi:hypothetical protein
VGLGIDDAVRVPTVFTKNRDRLLNTNIARAFLSTILAHKDVAPLLSDEHFSVDGTLVEAWASMKSWRSERIENWIWISAARARPRKRMKDSRSLIRYSVRSSERLWLDWRINNLNMNT